MARRFRFTRFRFGQPVALIALLALAFVADVRAARVSFLSSKTILRSGSSQIIAFRTDQPAAIKRFFSFTTDENVIRVLMPPTVLAGESIGYFRLIGLRAGPAAFEIGGARLEINVIENREPMELAKVEIVTPVRGTVVWGKFAAGVEEFDPEIENKNAAIVLRLPNGNELRPSLPIEELSGPSRRFFFKVDAAQLTAGANDLVAVTKDSAGKERRSASLRVWRSKVAPKLIAEGECRDQLDGPRPKHAGNGEFKLIDDPGYAGGKVVFNSGEIPTWRLPIAIREQGEYQMFVTARGEVGGGALPSLGLVLDDGDNPETTARLASTAWQRVAVGHPFHLTIGDHLLAVRFRNDFSRGEHNDRNLVLAHYELARVVDAAPESDALNLSFASPLDGRTVTGAVTIDAICSAKKELPTPRVQVFVNDRLVAEEQSFQPRFHVSAHAFHEGKNFVYLAAEAEDGSRVQSATGCAIAPAGWHPSAQDDPASLRFPVAERAWDQPPSALVDRAKNEAFFPSNAEASLALPEGLAGDYVVWIAARGEDFQGPPELKVAVKQPSGSVAELGRFPVKKDWSEIRAGIVQLQRGSKKLLLAFDNDLYEKGVGDRNLILRAVRLEPAQTIPDAQPPTAKVIYPAEGQLVGRADAVVAEVCDDRAIASVDLRIDGQSQKLNLPTEHGLGPVVLPLLTRGLTPGEHRLEAEARDPVGNLALSPAVTFRVAAPNELLDGPYQRAVLLLNRFGYGPEPRELGDVLTHGARVWLQAHLYENSDTAAAVDLNRRLDAAFPREADPGQVTRRAFKYLLDTGNPVRARFVMWAENHFSTWMEKIGAPAKAEEDRRFEKVGPAPFFDLLLASATSPAMLMYLDQRNSVAGKLNENYAREIMELHTLGVNGGYTQKDVTILADLLTGWGIAEEADELGETDLKADFRFDVASSSGHFCRVLGMEFPGVSIDERFDRIRMALEMLVANPSCADFVCRRLAEHYVSDPAPPALVRDLAKVFRETGGDLREVLLAMSEHPDFLHAPPRMASPIDYAVRAARMSGMDNPEVVRQFSAASGMGMFDRATPDGYPETDADFAGSNALLQRWRFAKKTPNEQLVPASWRPETSSQNPSAMRRMIDLVALRLTGNVLSDATADAALRLLQDAPPNPASRLALLVAFIGQSPEGSLR